MYGILAKILKSLAKSVVDKQKPKVVGITGSVGKTSTKEAVFSVLRTKYGHNVSKAYKNLNTDVGLPLAILQIKKSPMNIEWIYMLFMVFFQFLKYRFFSKNYPEVLVLEYAADKPGDISDLVEIVRPDVSVITEIGPAHLELFKTVEGVAKEKMKLATHMKADGVAVLNRDNKYIEKYASQIHYEKVWFSGSSIDGAKNAAQEVGNIFKLSDKEIKKGIHNIKPIKGRLNVFCGIKNTTLIDDTYNASPLSMRMALKYLREYDKKSRKMVVLGDMRELGESSEQEHNKLSEEIAKSAQFAILIGPQMMQYVAPILSEKNVKNISFENFTEAKKSIIDNIRKKDVILIKASQNQLFLERATEMLLKDKRDVKKLCRQTKYWKKIKDNTL